MNALIDNISMQVDPMPRSSPTPRERLTFQLEELGPYFRNAALETERSGRVPGAHVQRLRDMGYFKIVQPRAFGGMELGFDTLVDLNIQLARYCASTAWVCGLLAAHQWLLASFPARAQHDVWDTDPDALVCGSYAPTVKAQAATGGYRLTGRWAFASGCDNAQWSVCAAILPAESEQAMRAAFLLVPAQDFVIDDDWDVIGLNGTGSKTLVLKDAFVPAHRVLTFAQTLAGKTPGAEVHAHNPEFSIPMLCNIPSCLASVAVGAASGALSDYVALTTTRVTRGAVAGANSTMAQFPTIQLRIAEAAASTDAAREILLRDLREHSNSARDGRPIGIEQRISARRGQAFAVSLALRAAEALNASTGGYGLAKSNPIQRAWRDANAVSRHISMNWDAVGTMFGQWALGLEPKGQY